MCCEFYNFINFKIIHIFLYENSCFKNNVLRMVVLRMVDLTKVVFESGYFGNVVCTNEQ